MRVARTLIVLMFLCESGYSQNIQSGDFSADATSEGWTLDRGTGVRTHIVFIKFEKAFLTAPTVHTSLTGFEAAPDSAGAVRISSRAENVTATGFVIRVWTIGTSRVSSVAGSWLAIERR